MARKSDLQVRVENFVNQDVIKPASEFYRLVIKLMWEMLNK